MHMTTPYRSQSDRSHTIGRYRRHLDRGFTLIELLAVIATIGILVAVVVPLIGKARDTALAATCLSHLRGFHTIVATDIQENNNTLPLAYDSVVRQSWTQYAWSNLRYTEHNYTDLHLFSCPLQLQQIKRSPMQTRTYGMNLVPTRVGVNPNGSERRSIDSIPHLSRTVILADGSQDSATYYNPGFAYEADKRPEFLHGGKANFIFLDGHAEALRADELPSFQGAWPNRGAPDGFFWQGH